MIETGDVQISVLLKKETTTTTTIIPIPAEQDIFSSPKRPDGLWGSDSVLFNVYLSSYSEARRSEHEVNNLSPSMSRLRMGVTVPLIPIYVLMALYFL
jgi:hypothetical protein